MNHPIKVGLSFGLTSGIITTLGLIIGLNSGTHSKLIILGGILTIAIADSLSDALGIHMSEEAENKHKPREIWQSTFSTFIFKFIFALSFVIPILLFDLSTAIIISVVWGLSLISILSFYIAKKQKKQPLKIILEHLFITILVIIATHFIGTMISKFI